MYSCFAQDFVKGIGSVHPFPQVFKVLVQIHFLIFCSNKKYSISVVYMEYLSEKCIFLYLLQGRYNFLGNVNPPGKDGGTIKHGATTVFFGCFVNQLIDILCDC